MNILVWEIVVLLRLQLTKEIWEGRSGILKKCPVYAFRTAHQYSGSAHWYFILVGLSDTWEVHTDSISDDFCELHTDLWEVRTSLWEVLTGIQEGRYDA